MSDDDDEISTPEEMPDRAPLADQASEAEFAEFAVETDVLDGYHARDFWARIDHLRHEMEKLESRLAALEGAEDATGES